MKTIIINTQNKKQIIDITQVIEDNLQDRSGVCHIFIQHTTAAIGTADLDPGTDLDMLDAFEVMIPKLDYRHPHNPDHVTDHIISTILGSSVSIPYQNGKLLLGTWQRVILAEFNGPKSRSLVIS